MIETGTFLQQRYRIDRQIGQGGMGAVYIAKDERFDSTVAIKETLCFSDENFRKAIEREARLLNSLRHAALPRVSDHFEEQNGQFLVMEYIPGEDVGAMLESQGRPFPVDQVLKWADQLLDALDYLHNQEMPVIHRDIKPQNLKINSRGEAILLDFGLAKGNPTDAGHLTAAKSIFGYSRNYASLEQIQGTGTDPRSDLYSLAATLYHLLTNAPPDDALTRAMSVLSKKGDPLVPASSIEPAVPRGVAGVLQKAMDLDAAERPASAAEMREMLRNNEKYAHLADALTEAVRISDPHIFVQPTQLMSEKTHVAGDGKTGVATEVIPMASVASLLTSVRPTGKGAASTALSEPVAASSARKRRIPAFAGVLSLILVACAVAGAVYVAKPSVFGTRRTEASPEGVAGQVESRPSSDADKSAFDLEQQNIDQTGTTAPAVETQRTSSAAGRSETSQRSGKTSSRTKADQEDDADTVVDLEVDDSEIPRGGGVLTDKDERGRATMLRVNPKSPQKQTYQHFDFKGFNPFPPGFDFKTLSPAQQRKLQQVFREKQMRAYGVPPPRPAPKPTTSPE